MNYCTKHNDLCEYANAFGYCSITACTKYTNRAVSLPDGIYMELFAVKDGTRYNTNIMNMRDVSTTLTSSLMDGIEKLWR